MNSIKNNYLGIIFVLIISYISIFTNDYLSEFINLEALTIAIIIGIVYGNTVGIHNKLKPGISFSLKKLLKVGIVLLGFKLNIYSIMELGPKVLIIVLLFVPFVLLISILIGKRMNVSNKLATLIGVGSSICGASAVVALAPTIDADEDESIIAVSIVSFLGAIGVLIYSAVATSSFNISLDQYGVWSGLTLHGVAHAIAAAFAKGQVSGQIGTFVKMTRVLMLVPVSLSLGYLFNNNKSSNKVQFPMYVFYFIIAGVINSLGFIPSNITFIFSKASSILILMAMTAMGLTVDLNGIMNKGIKALLLGSLLFIIVSSFSLLLILNIL